MTKAFNWLLESPAPVWGAFLTATAYAMSWTILDGRLFSGIVFV